MIVECALTEVLIRLNPTCVSEQEVVNWNFGTYENQYWENWKMSFLNSKCQVRYIFFVEVRNIVRFTITIKIVWSLNLVCLLLDMLQ